MIQYLLTHSPLFYFTQSLWRDEVFSIYAASKPVSFIVTKLGFEPPFYYLLLHYWIKLFGQGEIASRTLSFLGFSAATVIVILWAEKIFKKKIAFLLTPLLFFLNPMLLYYAFEVRTYGWYVFFMTLSLYAYTQKKWKTFTAASILGFYTHIFILPFLGTIFLHHILWEKLYSIKWPILKKRTDVKAFALLFVAMIPWLIKTLFEAGALTKSWFFPVDWHLIRSVLGNMLIGYEGTPWYGWEYTAKLSLLLLALFLYGVSDPKQKRYASLFAMLIFLPLTAVIGISFVKPLFVNRYMIPVTIAEVMLLGVVLERIKKPLVSFLVGAVFILFCLYMNWWYPTEHPKKPFRATMTQINMLVKPGDVIFASSSLSYFETLYYAKDKHQVFLYNPSNTDFPWYVGSALFTKDRQAMDIPEYPARAFVVSEDATYQVMYRLYEKSKNAQ